MSKIRRGWALTKKSWALLNSHRELIRFPLYGAIATTLLAIVFLGPGLYLLDQDSLGGAIPLLVIGVYVLSVVGFYFSARPKEREQVTRNLKCAGEPMDRARAWYALACLDQ